MVIVDFSHLSMRNLYVALSQARPTKEDGQYVTGEYINFYYHLMLQSLRYISTKFHEYGDIVLALDTKTNWRKEVYPDYKGHRKKDRDESDVNFPEFFKYVAEFTDILHTNFPYKVIQVDRAEADDIVGVLARKYAMYEKTVAVSSDKDFKQILEYGAELHDPIKKANIRMTPEELKEWKLIHILVGDAGDNIPHIKRGTQFTDTFLAYLKQNEIYINDPEKFNELSISEKLYSEFDTYKTNKKGEVLDELDIFKATPFGEAGAKKFIDDLVFNLKQNKIYQQNFARNKELVLFNHIPEDVAEAIEREYAELPFLYEPTGIMQFLTKHSLTSHLMNITEFYVEGNKSKNRNGNGGPAMAEWV